MIKSLTLLTCCLGCFLLPACAEKEATQVPEKTNTPEKIKDITAVIKTSDGDIHVTLYASKTPVTVANFCNLAKRGYYKGSNFHRVIKGFVSQAGMHISGARTPGYNIDNETYTENPAIAELKHSKAGMLSMARLPQKHTNGAQWYITHAPTSNLDGAYTVFGEVTEGLEIALNLNIGTLIKDIDVTSDTTQLFKFQEKNVTQWNKTLDEKFRDLRPIEENKE